MASPEMMRRVRSKNTAPELKFRKALYRAGYRYRIHAPDLPGRPDVVLVSRRVAIFVHGCFWHGCARCDRGRRRPKANASFWAKKLDQNVLRDSRARVALEERGWRTVVIWECEVVESRNLASLLESRLEGASVGSRS